MLFEREHEKKLKPNLKPVIHTPCRVHLSIPSTDSEEIASQVNENLNIGNMQLFNLIESTKNDTVSTVYSKLAYQ